MPDSHRPCKIPQRGLVLLTAIVGLIGCATQYYGDAPHKWDSWIGTSKDDRVRESGIPTRCHAFKNIGEICEWQVRWTQDTAGTIDVQFDAKGIACHWTYRDYYGERQGQATCS
jgi:hypothetical protein